MAKKRKRTAKAAKSKKAKKKTVTSKKAKKKTVKSKRKTKIKKTKTPSVSAQPTVITTKEFKAAFYSRPDTIDPVFVTKIRAIEAELKQRVVLLWHGDPENKKWSALEDYNYLCFAQNINALKKQEPVAVVVHSPGGMAGPAFKLACLLGKHCGGFTAVIPFIAKSAATLFVLGADKMLMSPFAEVGPLDVQIVDPEKEERFSALEVVQAIERLNSEAMRAVDQQMMFWLSRSGKKVDTLLPLAMHFVAEMMKPLFDKIDTVDYTGKARVLKVAQDYAERLLQKRGLKKDDAEDIADKLTNAYSEHGYIIDCDELKRIGINNAEEATGSIGQILEDMVFLGSGSTFLGPLEEV